MVIKKGVLFLLMALATTVSMQGASWAAEGMVRTCIGRSGLQRNPVFIAMHMLMRHCPVKAKKLFNMWHKTMEVEVKDNAEFQQARALLGKHIGLADIGVVATLFQDFTQDDLSDYKRNANLSMLIKAGNVPGLISALEGVEDVTKLSIYDNYDDEHTEQHTLLTYAVTQGNVSVVQALFDHKQADALMRTVDEDGYTPLARVVVDICNKHQAVPLPANTDPTSQVTYNARCYRACGDYLLIMNLLVEKGAPLLVGRRLSVKKERDLTRKMLLLSAQDSVLGREMKKSLAVLERPR